MKKPMICRFGIHRFRVIHISDPSPLIAAMSALTYLECQRCGQVRKWFNSGEWGSFLVGKWVSLNEIPEADEFRK